MGRSANSGSDKVTLLCRTRVKSGELRQCLTFSTDGHNFLTAVLTRPISSNRNCIEQDLDKPWCKILSDT